MLADEQTERFKAALKSAYSKGYEDGICIRYDDTFDFDVKLSKIIWYCLHGTEDGQFKTKTEAKE